MGESGLRVVRVQNPDAFEWPGMRALFEIAFKAERHADANEVLAWAPDVVEDENFFFVVAIDGNELVGLTIASFGDGPFDHHPYSIFAYASMEGAFDMLTAALGEWSIAISGQREIAFVNTSGRSDEWYIERIRAHASGRVIGSLIHCEWHSVPPGDGGGEIWAAERKVQASQRTLPQKSSDSSEDLSPTISSTGLRGVVRRIMDRLLRR